jgi:hypothetical protein
MQKSMVLVASMAVLNPPQKMMPEKKPTTRSVSKEYLALGLRNTAISLVSIWCSYEAR